jgi:hypothetical protein
VLVEEYPELFSTSRCHSTEDRAAALRIYIRLRLTEHCEIDVEDRAAGRWAKISSVRPYPTKPRRKVWDP